MGIYATVMSLGFCVGPLILPLTGFEGWPPFMVGVGSIIGFVSTGSVMQLWGPAGLPLILGIPFTLFAFMLLWRRFNYRTTTE